MGNPKFTLRQFSQLQQTCLPNSSAPLHKSPTLRSLCHMIVLFGQLGHASKSPHTGVSTRDTPPFTISTLHQKLHCAHLHDERALTQVVQEPMLGRRTSRVPTKISLSGARSHNSGATHCVHAFLQPMGDPAHALYPKLRYAFYFCVALPKNGHISKLWLYLFATSTPCSVHSPLHEGSSYDG